MFKLTHNDFIAFLLGVVIAMLIPWKAHAADTAEPQINPTIPGVETMVPEGARALTGVLVTECNQIWFAHLTLEDGRLVRLDRSAGLTDAALEALVMAAKIHERADLGCQRSDTYTILRGQRLEKELERSQDGRESL